MFDYQVMGEEEAMQERFQILKEGDYDGFIELSEDKISQNSGNPMMAMTLTVFDSEGKSYQVKDYLVFTKKMMWKVIHCAESAGLSQEYHLKKFCSQAVIGKRIRAKIGIETGSLIPDDKLNGRPSGATYPDKNKVEDYIKRTATSTALPTAPVDEDVPF